MIRLAEQYQFLGRSSFDLLKMSEVKRAYQTLGLQDRASFKEVMEAHRDLADVWDPERFFNNPRLQKKATENIQSIDEAFQILRSYHLREKDSQLNSSRKFSSEILSPSEPRESQIEVQEQSKKSSFYDEVFLERVVQPKKRIPIWFIPVPIFLVFALIIYFVTPSKEEQEQLFEFPKNTQQKAPEDQLSDGKKEDLDSGEESINPITEDKKIAKKSTGNILNPPRQVMIPSPPVEKSKGQKKLINPPIKTPSEKFKPAHSVQTDKPFLRRGALRPEKEAIDVEASFNQSSEGELANQAFRMLKEGSPIIRRFVTGETIAGLKYQEWRTIRSNGSEFWIDLVAYRPTDNAEFHLVWRVSIKTGTVTALSQAARDLQFQSVPPQDS